MVTSVKFFRQSEIKDRHSERHTQEGHTHKHTHTYTYTHTHTECVRSGAGPYFQFGCASPGSGIGIGIVGIGGGRNPPADMNSFKQNIHLCPDMYILTLTVILSPKLTSSHHRSLVARHIVKRAGGRRRRSAGVGYGRGVHG